MRWMLFAGFAFFPLEVLSQDAAAGQKAYMKYQCYTCHGTAGQGGERGAGPKLAPNPFPWEGFRFQVRTPRRDMPPYRQAQLSDKDLADIYAYVAAIKPGPAPAAIPLLRFD